MPLVFVYGPDAIQSRMFDRVGSSNAIGPAIAEGFSLVFDKPNMKNPREGLANIREDGEGSVFGILFDLSRKQIENLDGYFGGYEKKTISIKMADAPEVTRHAEAWIARRTKSGLLPSPKTLSLTLQAFSENKAPGSYSESVESTKALEA